jgi:hypothetical protein
LRRQGFVADTPFPALPTNLFAAGLQASQLTVANLHHYFTQRAGGATVA